MSAVEDELSERKDQPHHSAFTQDIKTPAGTYPAYIILALLALIALRPDVIGQYLSR